MRRASILGVAIAAFALLPAQVALAGEFTASWAPAMLRGDAVGGAHVFTIEGSKVECKKATLEKSGQGFQSSTVNGLAASYKECTAFGIVGATVEMRSCGYDLLEPNAEGIGNLAITCFGGEPITITAAIPAFGTKCEVQIGAHSGVGQLTYTNHMGSPTYILIDFNVSGLSVNKSADTGLCPLGGTGKTTATYTGDTYFGATDSISFTVDY